MLKCLTYRTNPSMIFLEVILFFPEKVSMVCRNDFTFHSKIDDSCD